ncbi:PepSY domain-containing protein [Algoriphagus sp. AK58]|uniref:PepSY-associated TM helix domain-containing protein n=1 Tax=Algoriphagus sp. AK58 TaxID=1406877 RepID=UPI001650CD19|nr:PepSY-associated TM helix domain-containing protein [Algoriphagus sp. AK58]MBC6368508.1 iron transporter [Algoriphagus sp. AK58]
MWKPVRKFLNDIHLYAGLTCGLIVIAVCLSGTIYVYNTEIREFFDSERYFVEEKGTPKSLDELKSTLEQQLAGQVVGVNVFQQEGRTVQFLVKEEGQERPATYFVDPYTGSVLANNVEKTGTEEFMGYMFSLHRWLLLDKIEEPIMESMTNQELGRFINGVATLLFLLGVITGMVIWVPQKVKNWKQGLKVKWSGNWKRINHDLHNTLAFYSLGALFIMAVTGPFWSYQWYKTGWQKTWDTYQPPKEEKKGPAPEQAKNEETADEEEIQPAYMLSLDEIMLAANTNLDYAGNVRITLPQKSGGEVSISKSRTGFFARAGADQLKLNPENLEVKETNLFGDLPVRQQIGRSVKALHTGEIFGQFTKFLWFLGCLIATSLPITGTLIWLNKKKKKKPSKARKAASVVEAEMA